MTITALQEPRGLTATDWLQFAVSIQNLKERKKIRKREKERFDIWKGELLPLEKEERAAGIKLADAQAVLTTVRTDAAKMELGERKRYLEATANLPTLNESQRKTADMQIKLLEKGMKSQDLDVVSATSELILSERHARLQGKELRSLIAQSNAANQENQLLRTAISAMQANWQQEKDKNSMFFNMFLGEASEQTKEALGDDKFAALQAKGIGEIAGEKVRATPHDYGMLNIVKEPREGLDFSTALRYWKNGNIDDASMWNDWSNELKKFGYRFDASTSAIVAAKGGAADLSEVKKAAQVRELLEK